MLPVTFYCLVWIAAAEGVVEGGPGAASPPYAADAAHLLVE